MVNSNKITRKVEIVAHKVYISHMMSVLKRLLGIFSVATCVCAGTQAISQTSAADLFEMNNSSAAEAIVGDTGYDTESLVGNAAKEQIGWIKVAPVGMLPIRTSPPSGFWNYPGEEIAKTNPTVDYGVVDAKSVQRGFSIDTWVHVVELSPEGQLTENTGWVYAGSGRERPISNFEPIADTLFPKDE